MSTDNAGKPRPFDVHTIEHLIRLMAQHDLAEIALQEGDQKVRLRKAGAVAPVLAAAPAPVAIPTAAAPAPAAPAAAAAAPAPAAGKKLIEIKSEMVGSFYTRPAPGKPDYVQVGAVVKPESIVCVIVAMKVNNEIAAGVSGRIAEVCLKNEDPVDYGTVLFRVEPG